MLEDNTFRLSKYLQEKANELDDEISHENDAKSKVLWRTFQNFKNEVDSYLTFEKNSRMAYLKLTILYNRWKMCRDMWLGDSQVSN